MDHHLAIAVISAAIFLSSALAVLACIVLCRKLRQDPGDLERGTKSSRVADCPETTSEALVIRQFTWSELECLTTNFSTAIGEGGFSTVYLAGISPSSLAAVKVLVGPHHHREFNVLRRLSHPNIVRLLGYCDGSSSAIVFDYVPCGSLQHHLQVTSKTLTWTSRISIARQMAEALQYLHEECDPHVVHGDIKPANVLLDGGMEVKLCDFGSSQVGFSSLLASSKQPLVGSPGYVDPYYVRTGMMTKKSDVYSFGVVLLELITGTELPMTTAVKEMLVHRRVGELVVDTKLAGVYDREEVAWVLELVARCVGEQPSGRPAMAEVVRVMKENVSSATMAADGEKELVGKLQASDL